jgi:hypothetical protein
MQGDFFRMAQLFGAWVAIVKHSKCAIVLTAICFFGNMALAQTSNDMDDAERNRVHVVTLCNQCSMASVDSLPVDVKSALAAFFTEHKVNPAVARKVTWSMMPVFNNALPRQERIWFCKYMISSKENQTYYPIEYLRSYLVQLSIGTNHK